MDELIDVYDRDRKHTGLTISRVGAKLGENQYMLYTLAILEDLDGRMLLTRRSLDKRWGAGWWEIPGGGVHAGESTSEAVRREVREETGLILGDEPLEPVYSYQNTDLARGDNYIVDIYRVRLDFSLDDVKLLEGETIDARLCDPDELRELHEAETVLHYERICQALEAGGAR